MEKTFKFANGKYQISFRAVKPWYGQSGYGEWEPSFNLKVLAFGAYRGGYFEEQWGFGLTLCNMTLSCGRMPNESVGK